MNRALIVTGSYKGVTGHDHHTRSIVRALHNRGMEIELRDLPQWSPAKLPYEWQDSWFETLRKPVQSKTHLHFCMPHQVRKTDEVRAINYTMFEADRIPEHWVECHRMHDLIVVPVESCRRAWVESGVPAEKVALCPLGVDADLFMPGIEPLWLGAVDSKSVAEFRYRFLNIAEVTERKNYSGLLRSWLTATDASDDAVLILKAGFYLPGSRSRLAAQMQELEVLVGKTFVQAAKIFWVEGTFPSAKMSSLYAAATHYISLSRGEGFDLPMTEAAVSGMQLIAPRHSAYVDYLNDRIAHFVPARSAPALFPDDPGMTELFAGASWWEPDIEEAVRLIRDIIDGKAARKDSARSELSKYSWAATAEILEQLVLN